MANTRNISKNTIQEVSIMVCERELLDKECFEDCMRRWGDDEVCEEECSHVIHVC